MRNDSRGAASFSAFCRIIRKDYRDMRIVKKYILAFVAVCVLHGTAQAQQPCFKQRVTPWADSLMKVLTLDQKIGQLFMVAAWSDPNHKAYNSQNILIIIYN